MKINNKRRLIIAGIVFSPVIAAAVAFPFFARARENARRESCQNNMKMIAMAMALYAKDYDDRLPPVALQSATETYRVLKLNETAWKAGRKYEPPSPYGWSDALHPYCRSHGVLHCPSDYGLVEPNSDGPAPGYTSYWLNSRVAGRRRASLKASNIIMNGDGTSGPTSTARYAISGPPADLSPEPTNQDGTTQPPWPQRHLGGANYSFVDGHFKWLTPEMVSTAAGAKYTFAPN